MTAAIPGRRPLADMLAAVRAMAVKVRDILWPAGTGDRRAGAEVERLRKRLAEVEPALESLTRHFTEFVMARRAELEVAEDRQVAAEATEASLAEALAKLAELRVEFTATKAALDQATRISVPAWIRDTDGEDTLTVPLPEPLYGDPDAVRALWAAPFAGADPAHIPLRATA